VANNINDYGIVIGIDNYSQLRSLRSSVRDATNFCQWLLAPEGGGLPADNVHLIVSPPGTSSDPFDARPVQRDIDNALSRLVGNGGMRVGRRLYFYFAGHGIGSSVDDVSMLMANASAERLYRNIGLQPYRSFFRDRGLFDELVFILDCSRDRYINVRPTPPEFDLYQNESFPQVKELVILSAASGRRAFDVMTEGEPRGVLTSAVLEGLQGKAVDAQGRLTSSGLSNYVRQRTTELAPSGMGHDPEVILSGGEIMFQSGPNGGKGTLIVELPHWTAGLEIRDQFKSVPDVGQTTMKADVFVSETKLPPGIYEVKVTLEGKSAQHIVGIVPNQNNIIKRETWKDLTLACAAPLAGVASSADMGYAQAAKHWSLNTTWNAGAHSGNSGLFVFMSATDPEERSKFASSLFLIDGEGKLVGNFSGDHVERDDEAGWGAFNANLKPGYYVLRRGRHYQIRQQGVFLCPGWQTQVFLKTRTRRRPSLRLMTLSMARPGEGFKPEDETTIASEAVLDMLRYGGKSKQLLTSVKMSALLKGKIENPWLGILAAYVLRPDGYDSRDSRAQQNKSEWANLESLVSPRQEDLDSAALFDEVMEFLRVELADHPDVRALWLMREQAATPFPHPPLLRVGLKMVQHHSTSFAETVPLNSLTDLVLDNLVLNSPWTAWRELVPSSSEESVSSPFAEDALSEVTKRRRRTQRAMRAVKSMSAQTLLQSESTNSPVFNLRPDDKAQSDEESGFEASSPAPAPSVALYEAILIQEAARLSQSMTDYPEKCELDFPKLLNDLIASVKAEEISALSGMPLSRINQALDRLRRYAAAPPTLEQPNLLEELLTPDTRSVFKYVLKASGRVQGRSGQAGGTETLHALSPLGTAAPGSSATIEDIVLKLRAEARRLLQVDDPLVKPLSDRLRDVGRRLLRQAEFIVLTKPQGALLRGNGPFMVLVLPTTTDLANAGDSKEIWMKNCTAWESLLAQAPTGHSMIAAPVANFVSDNWELQRIAIDDSLTKTTQAYLNLLRCTGSQRLPKKSLVALDALMPELTLDASYFAHGDASRRLEYSESLKALTSKIQGIVNAGEPGGADVAQGESAQNVSGAVPEADMPVTNASQLLIDDPELKLPDSTLYESEFWGIDRHELIAGVAEERMLSEKAKKAVRRILSPLNGMMLSDVAGWADKVKRRKPDPLKDDKDTIAFLEDKRNERNDEWHYVNLPLDATEYNRETYPKFTRDDDVVQMMRECIGVLQGQSDRFSELNALRMLVHLAGDVHQPAHVGCCYIDESSNPATLVRDPKLALEKSLKSDEGGNDLLLPIGTKGVTLHSYWDSRLGGTIKPEDFFDEEVATDAAPLEAIDGDAPNIDPELKQKFISKLSAMIDENSPAGEAAEATLGPPELWPQKWASESLVVAAETYESLKITDVRKGKFIVAWEGKEAYDKRCKPLVIQQVKLAAQNLAALLDKILG
jgi:hypothetical protein